MLITAIKSIMLMVAIKSIMLIVIMLSVIMLKVVAQTVLLAKGNENLRKAQLPIFSLITSLRVNSTTLNGFKSLNL
jgi:hypothetical protein